MDVLVKIPELVLKSTLKSHVLRETLLTKIIEELNKIPSLATFRLSNEITALVCTIIENAIKSKKDKVDKKKLAMSVLIGLFALNTQEQTVISNQIEYILENKLIKRIKKSITTKVYNKIFKKKQSKSS